MAKPTIVFSRVSQATAPAVQSILEKVGTQVSKLSFTLESVASEGALIPRWEKEKAIHGEKPYELLVADQQQSVGEVTYALWTKKIPVLVNTEVMNTLSSTLSADIQKHPLLYAPREAQSFEDALHEFLFYPDENGRVFVVEGGDGAGKQTQCAKLCDRLRGEGLPVETLDFPHDAARYGTLIRDLLSGRMGNIKEVNPLIFAALYGLNRHDTLPELQHWVLKGRNIVLDRYMTANFGHQASKYSEDSERIAAIETLRKFELNWLGLPDAHRVIYLNLPAEFALKAMQADGTRKELDMHELAGVEYKNKVRDSFVWCCKTFDGWNEVKCVDEEKNERFSREDLHEKIYGILKSELVKPAVYKA